MNLLGKNFLKKTLKNSPVIIALILIAIGSWPIESFAVTSQTGAKQPIINPPFILQSPRMKWTFVDEEMCEEATLMMAARWYFQLGAPTIPRMEYNLARLRDYQVKNFTTWYDSSILQGEAMMRDVFNVLQVDLKIITDEEQNLNQIKQAISDGKVVVFPAAGRLLKNKHFKNGGPVFHNILIYGYDPKTDEYIVMDPGTRFGRGFRYSATILNQAWHDWYNELYKSKDKFKDILKGPRRALVVSLPQK